MGKFNACFPKEFDPKPGPAGFPHRKRPGNTLPGPAVSPTWTLPSAPGRKKNGGQGPAGNSLLSLSRPRGPPVGHASRQPASRRSIRLLRSLQTPPCFAPLPPAPVLCAPPGKTSAFLPGVGGHPQRPDNPLHSLPDFWPPGPFGCRVN